MLLATRLHPDKAATNLFLPDPDRTWRLNLGKFILEL